MVRNDSLVSALNWLPSIDSRWLAVLAVQVLTLVAYVGLAGDDITAIRYLVYPFVWIDVAAWAVMMVSPEPAAERTRVVVAAVSLVYFLVLLYVAGFIGHGHASMTGVRVIPAAPGWGPMSAYQNAAIRLYLVPFQIIGYAALSYLLYVTLLDATRVAISGLVSCVGCAWSLVAPPVGIGAGGSSLGATLYDWSYDLTTIVFLLTVLLLVWGHQRARN